ncbi:MAG: hypothetical protein NXH82_08640 [Rhodobacteraceae bacterium]|nr:hypothetical protein [Paracoccaceae bacterium]
MDPLAPLIDALHAEGRLRVWSLVISLFGDLVQHRGGAMPTDRLGLLTGRIGVEPGALRTALSRLSRDGWVKSQRQGRLSVYRLTAQGLDQFGPATSRIFAPPRRAPPDRWAMAVGQDGAVRLCPADAVPQTADCVVVGTLERIGGAFREALLSPSHRAALAALAADLESLAAPCLEPLDAAAARMLLIHRWRRIALRFPDIAPEIMPESAPLRDPRDAVARIYARLSPRAEAWLDSDAGALRPMPPATAAFAGRFRNGLEG